MSTLEALRFVLDDARTPKSFATTSSTRCSTRCATTDRCSPRRKSNGWRSGTTRACRWLPRKSWASARNRRSPRAERAAAPERMNGRGGGWLAYCRPKSTRVVAPCPRCPSHRASARRRTRGSNRSSRRGIDARLRALLRERTQRVVVGRRMVGERLLHVGVGQRLLQADHVARLEVGGLVRARQVLAVLGRLDLHRHRVDALALPDHVSASAGARADRRTRRRPDVSLAGSTRPIRSRRIDGFGQHLHDGVELLLLRVVELIRPARIRRSRDPRRRRRTHARAARTAT